MSTPSVPHVPRAHARHRSSTLSSLVSLATGHTSTPQPPQQTPQPQNPILPPPAPLKFGQSTTLVLWVSDPQSLNTNSSVSSASTSSSTSSLPTISTPGSLYPGSSASSTPAVNTYFGTGNSLSLPEVVLNHDAWPGIAPGDVVYVRAAGPRVSSSSARKPSPGNVPGFGGGAPSTPMWSSSMGKAMREDTSGGGYFLFVASQPNDGSKAGGAQITVPKVLANAFGLQNRTDVALTKVPKEPFSAEFVEICFRDQYLGRSDMWRLGSSLVNRCIYVEQKITFVGCIGATIKCIYVNGRRVPSAYVTSSTKMIYRSMSAKTTIFIQVCRELWEFADDGERYYEKIVHFFLPSVIEKWQNAGTTHVVTIVLISRVYYEKSELEYAAGPLRQDDEGQWYKDFFKVIVDLEVVHDWKPSLVDLKESFWTFQRDILLTHHFHQHTRKATSPRNSYDENSGRHSEPGIDEAKNGEKVVGDSGETDAPPVRLVGRISFAHEGPILEALNLGLNPTETHYVDRSLFLTGAATIMITPGTGHFRVSKKLLRLTTARMLDQGFGLDLVCLTKTPLHRAPVLCFRGSGVENSGWATGKDADPLWAEEDYDPGVAARASSGGTTGPGGSRRRTPTKEKTMYWWEPFWICISFWDQQNNVPSREDRFIPRARMYEIQMLGLLEHDVSSTIAIPHLHDSEGVKLPNPTSGGRSDSLEALRIARDQFDSDVFATRDKRGPGSPASYKRPASPSHTLSETPHHPQQHLHFPRHHLPARPELSAKSSTSSVTTAVASVRNTIGTSSASTTTNTVTVPIVTKSTPYRHTTSTSIIHDPSSPGRYQPRSSSPSQLSTRSSNSNASGSTARRRNTNLSSKLGGGVGSWLLSSFRSAPSQPEVSVSKVDVERATMATTTPPGLSSSLSTPPSSITAARSSPRPITIKAPAGGSSSAGGTMRRSGVVGQSRMEDDGGGGEGLGLGPANLLGRPRSYASPISSPRDDPAGILAHRRPTLPLPNQISPIHPSKQHGSSTGTTVTAQSTTLARRWQHIFPQPTMQHQIKWKSLCAPSCLPLTTEYFPTNRELETAYQVYSYDVLVTPDMHSSFLLRRVPGMCEEDWPLLVMRQMAALRLAQGFQFIVAPSNVSNADGHNVNAGSSSVQSGSRDGEMLRSQHSSSSVTQTSRFATPIHPKGAPEFLQSIADHAYLSMSNQIHRISFDPVEQVIQVTRYVKRTTHSTEPFQYQCLVWPRLGDGYTEVTTLFSYPSLEYYGWNRLDMLVAGYEHDLAESLRYWRTRFIVIPSENPPPIHYAKSGERLSDEEVRLQGTDKLAELFTKARWYKPGEKPENTPAPRFLPTWLEPSACVLDENLMAQVDELHQAGPLRKKPKSDKTLEDMPLVAIAKAMREEDAVPIKDRVWQRRPYADSFTGYEMVSWLVREFKDVSTREQGAEWGARLLSWGLIEHCKGNHGFMDGHYFYRFKGEYASIKNPRNKWFRSASTVTGPRPEDLSYPSSTNLEVTATRAGLAVTPNATPHKMGNSPKKSKRRLVLSQDMIIDVDLARRSNQAETVILHHDIIQNPATAFHFELNWIGTTARCIDDLLQSWSRSIEKYGLRLVEAYVDPITAITDKNVFQSTFPIRLAMPPPVIPNLEKRLPEGQKAEHYFEHAILRHFGYILDIEAGSRYPNSVDIFYSYRRSSFKYSQFVHKSGLAFVQVIGGAEGFRWLTNRLAGASNSYNTYNAWGGGMGSSGKQNTSAAPSVAPLDPEKKERIATSELIQRHMRGLRDFCADAKRLQDFYDHTLRHLPLEESAVPTLDDSLAL